MVQLDPWPSSFPHDILGIQSSGPPLGLVKAVKLIQGIEEYMDRQGVKEMKELVGAIEKISESSNEITKVVKEINLLNRKLKQLMPKAKLKLVLSASLLQSKPAK